MTETLLRPNIAPVETEKRTFWPGLGRTETLLVAVCAVALLMVYNWLAYIWLDMIDEG